MAGEVAKAYVSIIPSFKGGKSAISRELDGPVSQGSRSSGDKAGGSFREGFMGRMRGMASAIVPAIGVAAVAGYVKGAITSAAELEQAVGGVDAVFGASAGQIHDWAATADQSLGLSKTAYSGLATILGAQLKNMGVPLDQLNGQTQSLVTLGADLAATFGGSTSEAVEALSSLLRGETDPIERYGVGIKEADIKARMAAMGLSDLEGEAAKAGKTQAILALLTDQTAAAQGQFGREASTTSGKLERQQARFENLKATVGEQLIPVFNDLLAIVSDRLLPMFEGLIAWVGENRWSLGLLAGIIGGTLVAAMVAWTASVWASTIALLANPITWIVIAVVALIAGLVLLVKNWDAVSEWLSTTWKSVVDSVSKWWDGLVDDIKKIPQRIRTALAPIARLGAQMGTWVQNVKDAAVRKFTELVTWVAGLPAAIVATLANLGTDLWNAGVNALNGFWDGLKSGWGSLTTWLREEFAGGIVGEVTAALGIHSPSRVFMGIGGNVGEGMRLGLEESATGVLGSMRNLAGDLSNTTLTPPRTSLSGLASPSAATATQAGPGVQIHAHGVDANEVAMKVGRKVDRQMRGMAVQG